jgi:hypothetical protein
MKDIEKLIENFFSKKESELAIDDLKNIIEEELLTEATFNTVKLVQYYDKWINQIQSGMPFIVTDDSGKKQEVVVDPSFISTLSSFNKDFTKIKEYFAPDGKYARVIPATDGKKYALSEFEKETFTKKTINLTDLKEGLVAYFYNLLSTKTGEQQIKDLVTAMTTDKKVSLKLPTSFDTDNVLIGPISGQIISLIQQANSGKFSAENNNTLLNSVSCALAMNTLLKSTKSVIVDRSAAYTAIRKIAGEITMGAPDKWNPADIYLYERSFVPKIESILGGVAKTKAVVTTTAENKIQQIGINELFSESEKQKIIAVSLKEQHAQHGKALSITKHAAAILKGKDIKEFSLEPGSKKTILALRDKTLNADDKAIEEAGHRLKDQKIKTMNLLKDLGVPRIHVSDIALVESIEQFGILEEIKYLSETGLKFSNLVDPKYKTNFLNKINNQEPFTLLSGEKVVVDPKVLPALQAAGTASEKIKTAFRAGFPTTDGRVINIGAFDSKSLVNKDAPSLPTSPAVKTNYINKEIDKTQSLMLDALIKKYECYRFLETYIIDFDKIKQMNSVMSGYKNPLLALTAYAVGLGGFNPTFYKVQGVSNGSQAKITKFEGQERLFMTSNKATLEDFDNYAGFKFKFVSEMGSTETGKPKLFETSLNFKFKGNAEMSIEVYQFKEKDNIT